MMSSTDPGTKDARPEDPVIEDRDSGDRGSGDRGSEAPDPDEALWRRGHTVGAVALLLAAVVQAVLLVRFTIDDAFITWRYGQTLVRHGVWNWDAWSPPVEAYTNPAYAFASIVPAAAGMSPELFFKLVSLALGVGLVAWVLTRRDTPPTHRLLMLALTVANPVFQLHLWSGLETPLFIVAMVVVYGALARTGRLGAGGVVWVLILALSRPEGMVFAALAMVWHWVIAPNLRRLLLGAGVAVALVAYWAVRTAYFGKLFPNTFYVKTGGIESIERVTVLAFNIGVMIALGALMLSAAHALRAGTRLPPPSRWWALYRETPTDALRVVTPAVLGVAAGALAVGLNRSSDLLMNYANRFEFQLVLPVLIVALVLPLRSRSAPWAAVAVAATVLSMATVTARPTQAWVLLAVAGVAAVAVHVTCRRGLLVLAAGLTALTVSMSTPAGLVDLVNYRPRLQSSHVAIGAILRDSPTTHRTLVVGDAGAIPLVSDWHTVDQYGLASTVVSEGRFDEQTLRELRPSVIIVNAGAPDRQQRSTDIPGSRTALQYALDPANGYDYLGGVTMRPTYSEQIYVSPDVDSATRARLTDLIARSRIDNDRSDWDLLDRGTLVFPFLRPPG